MTPAAQRFNPVTSPSQQTVEEEPQPVAEEEVNEEHMLGGSSTDFLISGSSCMYFS